MRKIPASELRPNGTTPLGRGAYGYVMRYRWTTPDRDVAVKVNQKPLCNEFLKEMEIMVKLDHKNIVRIFGTVDDEQHQRIVMELADNGSLKSVIESEKYFFKDCYSWLRQCGIALEYLHSQRIVHRDLKPENLLLHNDFKTLKVCDFGMARLIEDQMSYAVGTAIYMAPEVINSENFAENYDERCDVYSWAWIFYHCLTREPPFGGRRGGRTDLEMMIKIGRRQILPQYEDNKVRVVVNEVLKEKIQSLIEECWCFEFTNRPKAEEIVEIMDSWTLPYIDQHFFESQTGKKLNSSGFDFSKTPANESASKQLIYVIGGEFKSACYSTMSIYDPSQDRWTSSHMIMSTGRNSHGAVFLNKKIYIFGGKNQESSALDSVEGFDLTNNTRLQFPPMEIECENILVAVVDGKIYVGGEDPETGEQSISCYDPSSDAVWTDVKPMNAARIYHRFVGVGKHLYAIGGEIDDVCSTTVERYDTQTREWTDVAEMNFAHINFDAAVLDGNIYVCCARGFETYNIETNVWTVLPSPGKNQDHMKLAACDDNLYLIGGSGVQTVQMFDVATRKWREITPMDNSRDEFAVVVVDV